MELVEGLKYLGAGLAVIGVIGAGIGTVSYTHLRAHETGRNLVCRLLLEKKNMQKQERY